MPTPVFLTGFEHGVVATGAVPVPNDRIWHTVSGAVGIDTTTFRNGARSLRCNPSGAIEYVGRSLTSSNILVGSFAIRFETIPTVSLFLFAAVPSGTFAYIAFNQTTGKLQVTDGTTAADFGPVLSADTWYLVDFRFNISANPWALTAQVDGANAATANPAIASSSFTSWRIGAGVDDGTTTVDVYYDDLVLSTTSGDYPLGDHKVLVMRPNADGTHSFTAGDFGYGDAGGNVATSATDVWSFLDDTTIAAIDTTDSIRQKVIRSTGYVEVNFEPSPDAANAWGVQVHGSYDALATGANTSWLKWNDGGTILDVYSNAPTGADFSNTTVTYNSTQRATAPSGGAWTQAKLDAIKMRWGYSTDVTGTPVIHGLMLEVAYPTAASFTGSGALTANATVAAAGLLAFIGSAALGVSQPGISGSGALIENRTGSAALSVPAPVVASSGLLTFTGSGALLVTPPAVAGTGNTVFNVTGTGALGVPPPAVAGTGSITQASVSGSGALSVPAPSVVASGLETFTGTSALTVPTPSLSGAGLETFAGTAGLGVSVTVSGSGLEAFLGTAALTVPQPSILGIESTLAQGPIATHRLTVVLQPSHTLTVVLPTSHGLTVTMPRRHGSSIMDTYTTANADIRTSNAHLRTSDAPMGGF